ncbi:hypothetical protein [Halobacillus seohaensis]|uniref:Lipoprotein n=1 Tax=Halobacillus seohaensis TaxID=447421 RepID=A0ABW2EIC8_9BACI
MTTKVLLGCLLLLFLMGCSLEKPVDEKSIEDNNSEVSNTSVRLKEGEWVFSEDLDKRLTAALGKQKDTADEEELYEVLGNDVELRKQYLSELNQLLDHQVEDGEISKEEAVAQIKTMEFIFDE